MAFALGVHHVLLRKQKRLIPYRQDQTFLIYWIMEESRQTICLSRYLMGKGWVNDINNPLNVLFAMEESECIPITA